MLAGVFVIAVLVFLLAPTMTFGSVADEQRQGAKLSAQLRSGAKTCTQLSNEDFDHIGEYVMGRALGSTQLHEAMNQRMSTMMGQQAEQRMHELMGRRFSGCDQGQASRVGMMDSGMMGGTGGGWARMMRSGDWGWMMNGAWQGMSRADWQQLESRLLGSGVSSGSGGLSATAIIAIALGAALLASLGTLALIRRKGRSAA